MKNYYVIVILFMFSFNINAQVGIHTSNPKSTLHVQKRADLTIPDGIIPPRISGDSLRLKTDAYGENQNGAIIYVTSAVTNPEPDVDHQVQGVRNSGLFIYDALHLHDNGMKGIWNRIQYVDEGTTNSYYAARATGSLQLIDLSLNLLGSNIRALALLGISTGSYIVEIPCVNVNNNVYTVPSDGTYHISYSFRTGQGIRAELLSANRPGIIITKTKAGTTNTVALDYRLFGGLQLLGGLLGVVNISLTQGQINHIYNLKAGDVLRFGVIEGNLSLGILTDASAELSIHKVK